MTAPVLQFKRGNAGIAGTVPELRPGEPAISLNNFDFFIGIDTSVANNKFFGSHRYWERENETTNEPLKLKLVSDNGSESVNLRAPVGLANTFTYTLPATAIGYSGKVLSTNGDGDLSWVNQVDILGVQEIVIGIGTFINNVAFTTTTQSTSSTTGAVTIAGGLGVAGTSYFGSDLYVDGNITGTISTATRATTVDTVTAADAASTHYITFVNSHNGTASAETVYTDDGIYYNPGTNTFTTQNALFTGNVEVQGTLTGTATTATRAQNVDVAGVASNQNYNLVFSDGSGNSKALGVDSELVYNPNTNTFKVGTGVGITQFSGSVSTGTSTSSVPTSSAIIDYVGSQIGNVDLTLSIAGDTGTGSVNTSQTFTIAGTANEVNTSASGQTITVGLPDAVIVGTSLSAPTIKTATIQHSNGTQAATIDVSGNIVASQNLTVTGNLYVNGSTTQVNTETLTVEDRLIEAGKVQTSPPSDSTWDVGVLFNYYKSNVNKRAGVFWDDSVSRLAFASETTVTNDSGTASTDPLVTVNTWAPIEVGSLWVNDCAGQSQVISCTGTERFLQNITVDAGTF